MLRLPMKILEKNLLILASAGSGKTFQLGNRVIGLVAMGVAPEKIVALTFTRKAAREFADSARTKLADVATDETAAARLRADFGRPMIGKGHPNWEADDEKEPTGPAPLDGSDRSERLMTMSWKPISCSTRQGGMGQNRDMV